MDNNTLKKEYVQIFLKVRSQFMIKEKQDEKQMYKHPFRCNWLVKSIQELTQKSAKEIVNEINLLFFNSKEYQEQYLYLLNNTKSTFTNDASLLRFVQDEYQKQAADEDILNISPESMATSKFVFDEEYLADVYMREPTTLIQDIRIIIQELKAQGLSDDGMYVDYEKISESSLFRDRFMTLIQKLPFTDINILIKNENMKISFFLNCYNILNIHSIVEWKRTKHDYVLDRSIFYKKYKYNISGQNYSLDDIEHGILRKNDNFGVSKFTTFCLFLQGKSLSDKSSPRFRKQDPRSQLCIENMDHRIHFCLNCGALSCPPISVYDPQQLNNEMELSAKSFVQNNVIIEEVTKNKKYTISLSMLFKWYKGDFGHNNDSILDQISKYCEEQSQQLLQTILKNKLSYTIKYIPYNWTVNNYIKKY